MLPGVVSSRSPRARALAPGHRPRRRACAARPPRAAVLLVLFFSLITCCWYYRGNSRGDFTWDRHDFHPGVPPRRPPGVENGHRAARRTRTTGADGDGDGHRVSRPRVRGPVVDGEPTGPAVLDRGKNLRPHENKGAIRWIPPRDRADRVQEKSSIPSPRLIPTALTRRTWLQPAGHPRTCMRRWCRGGDWRPRAVPTGPVIGSARRWLLLAVNDP